MDGYIFPVEYDLVLKRKHILTHPATPMNFEDMILSEISQSRKDTYCRIPLV